MLPDDGPGTNGTVPYRHASSDDRPGLIELPEQPTLDDWSYGAVSPGSPGPLATKEVVLSIWQEEFKQLNDWGGLYMLVMHPQVTGRPMRWATLRDLIRFTRGFDGVWYARCDAVAASFAEQE